MQSLHVLFGITAIMGVLIAHVKLATTENTVYYTQLRWQIVTFWCALAGYTAALWLWIERGQVWMLIVVVLFVSYRLSVSIAHYRSSRAIQRLL